MKLVYAHNGQAPAAGKREVWIDANGDWWLLTDGLNRIMLGSEVTP